MTPRRVVLRQAARRDIDEVIEFYVGRGAPDAALRFIEQLKRAVDEIAVHPEAGSPRYGHELDLLGLRSRLITDFPYLVFYVERSDHIDVWRVLHGGRDIPEWLRP